jgi:hypothetical protein
VDLKILVSAEYPCASFADKLKPIVKVAALLVVDVKRLWKMIVMRKLEVPISQFMPDQVWLKMLVDVCVPMGGIPMGTAQTPGCWRVSILRLFPDVEKAGFSQCRVS